MVNCQRILVRHIVIRYCETICNAAFPRRSSLQD